MRFIRSVCVYCGSGLGKDPHHEEGAERLGRLFAENEVHLVYGGGGLGLMGTIARSVIANGGRVTGIIPQFLVDKERMLEAASEVIVTENMHERKALMFERADAFVALPGGVGTLEELVEQLTWAQLGRHRKPILIANIEGYWNPLVSMLNHMRHHSFIREGLQTPYLVTSDVDEILPMLESEAEIVHAEGLTPKLDTAEAPLRDM